MRPLVRSSNLWQHLYHGQDDWAKATKTPPLLANLGVSLIERAVLGWFVPASGDTIASSGAKEPARNPVRRSTTGVR